MLPWLENAWRTVQAFFAVNDAFSTVVALLVIEAAVLAAAEWPRAAKLFEYVPSMFWIYFLPMVANNLGLIPRESGVYSTIQLLALPACLVLLLLSVNVGAIVRLGPVALGVMLAGSLGIIVGGPIVLMIFQHWLPEGSWMGFGSLSASWVGGSANMIAVRNSFDPPCPANVYSPMVVVDTICPYAWMGLLIFLSSYQAIFDRWNGSRASIVDDLRRRTAAVDQEQSPITMERLAVMIALAGGGTFLALRAAKYLPVMQNVLTEKSWGIILATVIGVALSFTPARRLETHGASRLGYALLYFVLASIGAQTNVANLGAVPLLVLAGFIWIGIHAVFLLTAARVLRAPMSLVAAASQANIGGVASAPVVAGVYLPALAPVGLLLAILGNILGTYTGIFCAWLCRLVSG